MQQDQDDPAACTAKHIAGKVFTKLARAPGEKRRRHIEKQRRQKDLAEPEQRAEFKAIGRIPRPRRSFRRAAA